jgi:subtilisin-like proprotein convertase family protein
METVDIANPVTGDYVVKVSAYNVPNGPQPFAIVAHGAFGTVAPDTEPPVISSVSANPSSTTATVTWTTDEAATSVVNFGTSTSLGQTATVSGYATAHAVTISGLTAETTYYYKVVSVDASGNEANGSVLSFTTTAAPVIPTSFSDDMESGDSKWTKTPAGSTPWTITSTSYVHSGSNSWFSADEAAVKDDIIATEEVDLTSASTASLTFYHTYKFENNYDGGVIEISTNGGSSFADLGSKITTGGYTGTISTSYSSPIAGRSAWTGGSLGTMTQVVADLSSYVGNKVIVRFRLASDTSVGSTGWYVDDVAITSGGTTVPAPTIDSFSANPTSITAGDSATLTWTTTNATSCKINGSSVSVDGSMTVSPTTTTTYTLEAIGDGGTVTSDVTVTVTASGGSVDTKTFNAADVPKSIPDNNSTGVTSTLTLTDGYSIQSLSLSVNISHTYKGDLVVSLISPSGTEAVVSNREGGSADNIVATFDLTNFNGQDAVGDWKLKVVDLASQDTGTINSWSLTIKATYNSTTHVFSSSDTPISIPDNNTTGITSNLSVSASATVTSFKVSVDITHTYSGDLIVTLYTPSGASTVLSNREGGSADNIVKTWTVDASSGVSINGTWKLKVTDNAGYDVGTLNSWKLEFAY